MTENESWPQSSEPFEATRPHRSEAFPKRIAATFAFLVGCLPRRRSGRKALGVLTVLMAFAGVALLSYPFATQIWAKQIQKHLRNELHSQESIDAYKSRNIRVGGALTRLIMPTIKINVVVVEGITGNALRAGAGHYPDTPLPGERGNVAIAGHRTGFGQPFRHLEQLKPGDLVILETPLGKYTYQVLPPFEGHKNPWITDSHDFSVLAPTIDAELTLTTCDPPHTSKNRLIVRAKLIKTEIPT